MRRTGQMRARLSAREQEFAVLLGLANYGREKVRAVAAGMLDDLPFGVTEHQVMTVELTARGPAEWLEVWHVDQTVNRVVYHYADRSDHAHIEVDDQSAVWHAAAHFAGCAPERVGEGGQRSRMVADQVIRHRISSQVRRTTGHYERVHRVGIRRRRRFSREATELAVAGVLVTLAGLVLWMLGRLQ